MYLFEIIISTCIKMSYDWLYAVLVFQYETE